MATAISVPPSPDTCGPRMCRAIVDLGGDIMRDTLSNKINPAHIVSCCTSLKLNTPQLNILSSSQSQGDYSQCDITLLYTLLRNCNATHTALRPTNGWGKRPTSCAVSLGDNLERIRFMRNEVYGHIATTVIPCHIYTTYMNELQDICQRMDTVHKGQLTRLSSGTGTYSQMLNDIQICCMDADMEAKYIDEFKRLYEEDQQREKRIENLESAVSKNSAEQRVVMERVENLESVVQQQTDVIAEMQNLHVSPQQDITEEETIGLKDMLVENYQHATQCIPVVPLDVAGLPIDKIYAHVVVEEDTRSQRRVPKEEESKERKKIKSTADIFYVDGKLGKRIFMKGEAGRGKTVFGLKLVEDWCKVKKGKPNDMYEFLSQFEFTFYVSMRHEKQNRSKVVDMVCDQLTEGNPRLIELIKSVLCNEGICCLVILDGLDEWPSSSYEFPDTYGLVNCTLFTTSRPWKLQKLQLQYGPKDKVVEILGINPKAVETLITSIVTNFYDSDDQELVSRIDTYLRRAQDPKIESLMTLPLILTASCYVWCEEDENEDPEEIQNAVESKTYFLLSILQILIQRGQKNSREVQAYLEEHWDKHDQEKLSLTANAMALLSQFFPDIIDFFHVLSPFCKLAYDDLVTRQACLVFRKNHLEREFGKSTVEVALKVGFISQCRAPGLFNAKNISISFFHKLIQELMAALFITCNSHLLQSFCDHCDSVDKILELSNVLMFVTGLDSSIGSRLSLHITKIAGADKDIALWRNTMLWEHRDTVEALYRTQLECYSEGIQISTTMGTSQLPPFHVSDIYIYGSDSETLRLTGELVSNTHNTIESMFLWYVSEASDIIRYLPQHFVSLTVLRTALFDAKDVEMLANVLPLLTQLQFLWYRSQQPFLDTDVFIALSQVTSLQAVVLARAFLSKDEVFTPSKCTQLERIDFFRVVMSPRSWWEFLSSLLSIPHKVHVKLEDCNIDLQSIARIHRSSLFTPIGESMNGYKRIRGSVVDCKDLEFYAND